MSDTETGALLRVFVDVLALIETWHPKMPICVGDPQTGCCMYHAFAELLDKLTPTEADR